MKYISADPTSHQRFAATVFPYSGDLRHRRCYLGSSIGTEEDDMQSKGSIPLSMHAKRALVWVATVLRAACAGSGGARAQAGVWVTSLPAPAAGDGVVAPGTATSTCP